MLDTGQTPTRRNRTQQWVLNSVILCLVVAVALGAEWARTRATTARATWPAEVDTLYLPPARAIRVASLGHHELMADLLAARANIYFGDQLEKKGLQRWMSWYLNAVVDLDPYFQPVYMRGAVMLTYSTSKVTTQNVFLANDLLRRGLTRFPSSWELYYQLGFNLYYELPGTVAANDPRRRAWRKEGVEALRKAALFDEVPPWLPGLVGRMLSESGERELAIKHLERVYATTSDEEAREHIKSKLQRLLGEHYGRSFEAEAKRLKRLTQTRFPYASEAFSLIVGRRFRPYAPLAEVLTDPANVVLDPHAHAKNSLAPSSP